MRLFKIGHTEIRLHPGLIIVFAGAAIIGMIGKLLQSFAALTLHELFHAIVAIALGYRVDTIELLPFGGVARLGNRPFSPKADFFIAIAGPVCNFIVAGTIALAAQYRPQIAAHLSYFISANLSLALFNLLPALPLDGGRMLRAILARVLRARVATLIASWIGIVLGSAMLLLAGYLISRYIINPFLWVMGSFLLLSAVKELRIMPEAQLHAMLRRKDSLSRGEMLALRQVAVQADMPAYMLLRQLSSVRYNVILVLNEKMHIIGQLDEGALMDGIARKGHCVRIEELIKKRI